MEKESINFSMSDDGIFYKPTLEAYNKARKNTIYMNKEEIARTKLRANREIIELKHQIASIKEKLNADIQRQKNEIIKKQVGYTQVEFDKMGEETEKSLRIFVEKRKNGDF